MYIYWYNHNVKPACKTHQLISFIWSEQAVLEELRRESAERQRTLQEEIERLKIEKEEVSVDNSPSKILIAIYNQT